MLQMRDGNPRQQAETAITRAECRRCLRPPHTPQPTCRCRPPPAPQQQTQCPASLGGTAEHKGAQLATRGRAECHVSSPKRCCPGRWRGSTRRARSRQTRSVPTSNFTPVHRQRIVEHPHCKRHKKPRRHDDGEPEIPIAVVGRHHQDGRHCNEADDLTKKYSNMQATHSTSRIRARQRATHRHSTSRRRQRREETRREQCRRGPSRQAEDEEHDHGDHEQRRQVTRRSSGCTFHRIRSRPETPQELSHQCQQNLHIRVRPSTTTSTSKTHADPHTRERYEAGGVEWDESDARPAEDRSVELGVERPVLTEERVVKRSASGTLDDASLPLSS